MAILAIVTEDLNLCDWVCVLESGKINSFDIVQELFYSVFIYHYVG